MVFNPILTIISVFVGIIGGWIAGVTSGVITPEEFIYGLQYSFKPYYVLYSIIKTVVFAFIITSVAAYNGYYVAVVRLKLGKPVPGRCL